MVMLITNYFHLKHIAGNKMKRRFFNHFGRPSQKQSDKTKCLVILKMTKTENLCKGFNDTFYHQKGPGKCVRQEFPSDKYRNNNLYLNIR